MSERHRQGDVKEPCNLTQSNIVGYERSGWKQLNCIADLSEGEQRVTEYLAILPSFSPLNYRVEILRSGCTFPPHPGYRPPSFRNPTSIRVQLTFCLQPLFVVPEGCSRDTMTASIIPVCLPYLYF